MNVTVNGISISTCMVLFAATAFAQPTRRVEQGRRPTQTSQQSPVARMMTYDTNEDNMLTVKEVNDRRLHRVLKAADADSDGKTTAEELTRYFEEQTRAFSSGRRGFLPGGSPPGGPRGFAPGGPGGPGPGGPAFGGGPGAPPQPGQILSPAVQRELRLTETQQAKLAALQAHVDAELGVILTDQQRQTLQRLGRPRRGRGFGGPRETDRERPIQRPPSDES